MEYLYCKNCSLPVREEDSVHAIEKPEFSFCTVECMTVYFEEPFVLV